MIRLQPVLSRWQSVLLPRASALASKSSSSVVDANPAEAEGTHSSSKNVVQGNVKKSIQGVSRNSKMVAKVFANLNDTGGAPALPIPASEAILEKSIREAKDVETLLQLAATPKLTRKLALALLSTFGDWTADKKIKLSDFEGDVRFLKMCRILSQDLRETNGLGDLATVLGVTGDDEAAKLISSASLSQMVRILEKMSAKKKRSPPLLRSLAFNISKCDEKMNIKQCADVLFSMVNLSFHDEILLVKTCSDACASLTKDSKSAVIGSLARSLGMLRYRDTALLDRMAGWLLQQTLPARPQDIVAILMALATVNYHPSNADALWKATPVPSPLDMPTSGFYLDAVWSMLLLDRQTSEQLALVLSPDFIEKLRIEDGSNLSFSTTLKLLNINAAVHSLLKNYQGPRLAKVLEAEVVLTRSKDKTTLVNSVIDTLLNLLPGDTFLKRDVDFGAGFIIDGECLVDNNCTPLPVASPGGKSANRIAVMVLGYHDTCVGARYHATGVQTFYKRLLQSRGYKVLTVLHSEFSPTSKLVQRVQYLEQKLKALISS